MIPINYNPVKKIYTGKYHIAALVGIITLFGLILVALI